MERITPLIAAILTVAFFSSQADAVEYVQAPPLSQVVTVSVGEVSASDPVQVPLITWGGDIATIYANGSNKRTQKSSVFNSKGLDLSLVRQDDFKKQVEDFVSGKSPYLRGTLGMVNQALEVLMHDPRTVPVVVYQMTESNGGDALVVKPGIKSAKDLCGKTIAVQAYGPHVDYMTKVVTDACGSVKRVTIKWTRDLTGSFEKNASTPGSAFKHDPSVNAAFVIIPDALALTTVPMVNGKPVKGAEYNVPDSQILLSTKTCDTCIADVYAVRADYFQKHRDGVEKFVHGLMLGEEALRDLVKNKKSRQQDYRKMITAAAAILLDSDKAVADAEGLYADAKYVGYRGNINFFGNTNYLRNFDKRTTEIQGAFMAMGFLSKRTVLDHARWDYNRLKQGMTDVAGVVVPKFDSGEVAKVIDRKQKQGTLSEGELFSFEVFFTPDQAVFSPDMYADSFSKVVEMAATYGGAVITVEGHSDPLQYLKLKKKGSSDIVLSRTWQSAKNLSLSRANAVRDSVVAYAKRKGITVDPSQFVVVGHGIDKPKNGKCGSDPCAPRTEQEWRNNMRVEFRIIQIEAEASAFTPLQ